MNSTRYHRLYTELKKILFRKGKKLPIIAVIAIAFAAGYILALSTTNRSTTITNEHITTTIAQVVKVVDGDTITVQLPSHEETQHVRLIGIDAPELSNNNSSNCLAVEAKLELTSLVLGKTVLLQNDTTQKNRDIYDRLLRYVLLPDSTNINQHLIEHGFVYEYTYNDNPYMLQERFKLSEKIAIDNNVGLWSNNNCTD